MQKASCLSLKKGNGMGMVFLLNLSEAVCDGIGLCLSFMQLLVENSTTTNGHNYFAFVNSI